MHDRDNTFAHENLAELQEAGCLALTVPAVHDGGSTVHDLVLDHAELAEGDAATALAVGLHLDLCWRVAVQRL